MRTFWLVLAACGLAGCGLQRDIAVDLPFYASELVVEAYLVPGESYRLLLTESTGFFAAPAPPFVPDALVVISHRGQSDTLRPVPVIDTVSRRLFNYSSPVIVPAHTGEEFGLYVRDRGGRELRAVTRMMSRVAPDSVYWTFNDRNKASLRIVIPDEPQTANYYRVRVNKNDLRGDEKLDFELSDTFGGGQPFPILTAYRFDPQDTLLISLLNLHPDYYRFLETLEDAQSAAGPNPFAQPALIQGNVRGGQGIFTAFQPAFRRVILTR